MSTKECWCPDRRPCAFRTILAIVFSSIHLVNEKESQVCTLTFGSLPLAKSAMVRPWRRSRLRYGALGRLTRLNDLQGAPVRLRLSFVDEKTKYSAIAVKLLCPFCQCSSCPGRLSNIPEINKRNLGLGRAGAPCNQACKRMLSWGWSQESVQTVVVRSLIILLTYIRLVQ